MCICVCVRTALFFFFFFAAQEGYVGSMRTPRSCIRWSSLLPVSSAFVVRAFFLLMLLFAYVPFFFICFLYFFFAEVTKSKYVVCHFYHPSFERCKIIDKHMEPLATSVGRERGGKGQEKKWSNEAAKKRSGKQGARVQISFWLDRRVADTLL